MSGHSKSRRVVVFALILAAVAIIELACLSQRAVEAAGKPNVLFLAVDDLRPQLGCYGRRQMVSPNIDRLASQGVLFERAYCMVPTCGASRASLMSGVRPARDRFVNYMARADHDVPDVTTLNTHFKNHGYYACVSYTDAQIGKILDELDRLGLADDTIVILWADHGWNLGEHTLWCKHCTFETSMHAPLIVRVPGIEGGRRTRGLTEFIDIYPSLSELAGLPLPKHLEGTSFVPLLTDPDKPWKKTAIGRYRSGDTVRTDTHRFTEYSDNRGNPTARMLYDHTLDPGENVNIAEVPKNRETAEQLTEQLHAGMGRPTKK